MDFLNVTKFKYCQYMIKGKQHFKTIRFINTVCKSILLVLIASVMIENTSVIKDLNKIKETEKYWNVLDDYYTIEFAPYHETKQSLIDNMLRSEQLVKTSEAKIIRFYSNQRVTPLTMTTFRLMRECNISK